MPFENSSFACKLFVVFIVDAPYFDEPILRGSQKMIIIELENVSDCGLMSFDIWYFLGLHIKKADFSIGFSEEDFIRVLFSCFYKSGNTICREVSLMYFLRDEIDFGPDVDASCSGGGKHETVESLDFLDVLVLFVDLFGVD